MLIINLNYVCGNLYTRQLAKFHASSNYKCHNMDANPDANEQSSEPLQRLIRNIVSNVVTGNESWQTSPMGSSVRPASSSVIEELNQRFQIPRKRVQRQSVEVTGQLSGQPQSQPRQTTLTPIQFNPHQNYGRSYTPRKKTRQGQAQGHAPRRVTNNNVYIKNIFLLPSPSWTKVPSKESKDFLQTHGLVIDAYEIDKSWEYEELVDRFNELFKDVLMGRGSGDSSYVK